MIQRPGFATAGLLTATQISDRDLLKEGCTAIMRRSNQARSRIWTHTLQQCFTAPKDFTKHWTRKTRVERPCRFSLSAAIAKRRLMLQCSCATERRDDG